MFPGRARSGISARLGELAARHGNTRALLKRLWYVNREGKRVQVWALTGTGYALAEEKLGCLLKVPRHDVASQFLEHATGVNQLYVALARRPAQQVATNPGRYAGKLAADYAPLPTAFRWIPSEDLEIPFDEYAHGEPRACRLQPDAMLEDRLRRQRYLVEYETGSASVRNDRHKTATLAKIARYANFFNQYTSNDFKTTFYDRHFKDNLTPVILFLARTQARRDTIREAAEQRNRENPRKLDIRALMLDEAATHFRSLFFGMSASPQPSADPAALPPPDGVFVGWRELGLVRQVVNEALHTIQAVRHTVRAGHAVAREPRYPEHAQTVAQMLERLLAGKMRRG
jgi:Replication-relaxation